MATIMTDLPKYEANYYSLNVVSGVPIAIPVLENKQMLGVVISPDGLLPADIVTSVSIVQGASPVLTVIFASGATRILGITFLCLSGSY